MIILDAATALFVEDGPRAVTANRVAQRSGIARSTIYRHWPDRTSLLLDTIDIITHTPTETPAIGDLAADLTTALVHLRSRMDRHPVRDVVAALLEEANRADEVAPAQRRFIEGITEPTRRIVMAAIADGSVRENVDVHEATARLTGPLLHRHVLLRAPITDELIASTIAGFLATDGLRPLQEGRDSHDLECQ